MNISKKEYKRRVNIEKILAEDDSDKAFDRIVAITAANDGEEDVLNLIDDLRKEAKYINRVKQSYGQHHEEYLPE